MSPARKTSVRKKTRKKTTKKTTARKTAARKASKKPVAKAARKASAKPANARKAAKKAAAKPSPRSKGAAKAAGKKKSTKKPTVAKKATRKAGKKPAEAPKKPARPVKPGKVVVARGRQVPKLGDRWTCWACGAVFYDLNKPEAICPKCDQDQSVKPHGEEKEKRPARRDSMRALRVLDDDDAPAKDDQSGAVDMNIELGTNEKLLDEAEAASEDSDEE